MHPVARVSTNNVETSVRNKCRRSFYCALLTLHVSAPIGGHLQVVSNTKNSKSVRLYISVSLCYILYLYFMARKLLNLTRLRHLPLYV
jgi:hypothetical protein